MKESRGRLRLTLCTPLRLMRTLILLYACETGTLTVDLQRRIKTMEMRCYRRLLHILFAHFIQRRDHISDAIVCNKMQTAIDHFTEKAKGKMGRQHQRVDWTIYFNNCQRAAEDHYRWQKIVADISSGAYTTLVVPGHR